MFLCLSQPVRPFQRLHALRHTEVGKARGLNQQAGGLSEGDRTGPVVMSVRVQIGHREALTCWPGKGELPFWGGYCWAGYPCGAPLPRIPGGVGVSRCGMAERALPGMIPCGGMLAARALMSAFSIGRTSSCVKTGRLSIDPGTGSFHVLNISSILRRTGWSTTAYDSMNVLNRLRPK